MGEQYDPGKVNVILGVTRLQGFADGDMVVVEFAEDQRSLHVGTDGEGRHIRTRNRSGTATIRLADYSPSNTALTLIHEADTPLPLTIVDKTTKAGLFFASSVTVRTVPPMTKSNEASMNEWVLQFIKGKIVHSEQKD